VKLDYYHIKSVFLKKGYAFYDGIKPYNLNILGVRCDVDTNFFDDLICIAYRDDQLLETVEIFQATTDAGEYWLLHPSNSQGTAILCEGQYRSTYKIDKHGGKYDALCQRTGKVTVYRDGNKDTKHDMNPTNMHSGYYGINIHRTSPYKDTAYINKYSAGCQVFRYSNHFDRMMMLLRASIKEGFKNQFTYTLLNKNDFD
tara:strand:- start:289 stop:888 length:600 start_codon:yes stop_codon:yes gene_type:complete